jgi:Flp pilus assembly protein TadD
MAKHTTSRLTLGLSLLLSLMAPSFADDLQEATALYRQGKDAQALEYVDRFLRGHPKDDAQARFLKGVLLTETGRIQEAIQVFTKLAEDRPELPEPYNNLAVIYASQEQYDKARQALELAIQANPGYAMAHENLGDLYVKMASQSYASAQRLDPGNTNIQNKVLRASALLSGSRFAAPAAAAPKGGTARRPAATR